MRLHRFYIGPKSVTSEVLVDEERLVHQWRNVFRYNVGSEVILFDGSREEYDCVFKKLGNREALLEVISKRVGIVPKKHIILYQSIIKKDKMEWVIEKATELGVSKIVPIISERSEKKGFNQERAQKIAVEAAEQCGRVDVPTIAEVVVLDETLKENENIVVCDGSGSLELKAKSLEQTQSSKLKPLSLFIGPEGGWSEKELDLFKQKGAKICSLGPLTLRAETAAIVALGFLALLD
jgi:16S rRNA (uracil1498-N3)-methyltransferase